jgi:hypothetical protein
MEHKGTQLCVVSQTQQVVSAHNTHCSTDSIHFQHMYKTAWFTWKWNANSNSNRHGRLWKSPCTSCSSTWQSQSLAYRVGTKSDSSYFFEGTINSYSFTVNSNTVLYRINRTIKNVQLPHARLYHGPQSNFLCNYPCSMRPSGSPDFNTRQYLCDIIYVNNPHSLQELKRQYLKKNC